MARAARSRSIDGSVLPGGRGGVVARTELFARLGGAGRITVVSAPAGSGKTFLLRAWIADAGLEQRTAWVSVAREEHSPQRFWISVLDAIRATAAGSAVLREMTAAPRLDGGVIVERLLEDLGSVEEPVWLVIDDLHELDSAEALGQLKLLLLRSPAELRFVLLTRRDLRLGLHRLRLEGDLEEIRGAELRFTLEEARALFKDGGVDLSESALASLHERTEGWAAGLRLAALSLAAHPDPERFAAEFSGTERTVAEYLLDEVLDNLPDEVRQFLLRTSVLERVNGPLADLLSGGSGGEQVLLELEQANAFVVALDARRSWFRYHHLFADLLQLGLRRTGLDEVRRLHSAAATWFAEHEYPVQAVGHAQAAGDWGLAVRLLSDHWFALWLSGEEVTAHALLAGFPSDLGVDDPELAALVAADELNPGSLAHADQQLALATRRSALVPADRREHVDALLAVVRLRLARQRTDLPAAVEEAQRLLAPLEPVATPRLGLGAELRTVALLNLGVAELWKAEGARRLEQALALARQTQRPYLELGCLANLALALVRRSFTAGFRASTQAVDLAQNHGWTEEPIVGVAYIAGGAVLVWQLHLDEAARWLGRAQRAFRAELEPAQGLLLHRYRGMLELARGRDEEALAALRAAVRLEELLAAPHPHSHGSPHSFAAHSQALMLQGMLRMGETERVRQALMEMDDGLRESPEMRKATAALLLAQNDPEAAAAVLEPVIDGSVPTAYKGWLVGALVLEAIARDALGDAGGSERSLERALELAEPDGLLWPFLFHPASELIARHQRHRTSHASLVSEILTVLAGKRTVESLGEPDPLLEPLSHSETRVLRYLPTNLSAPEIANELYLAVSTVKTHIHHIYAKLDAHHRADAVERARALGLLAPSSLKRR